MPPKADVAKLKKSRSARESFDGNGSFTAESARAKKRALEQQFSSHPEQALALVKSKSSKMDFNRSYNFDDDDTNNGGGGENKPPVRRSKSGDVGSPVTSGGRQKVKRNKSSGAMGSNNAIVKTKVKLRDTDRVLRKTKSGAIPAERGRSLQRQGSNSRMVPGPNGGGLQRQGSSSRMVGANGSSGPPQRGVTRSKSSDGASLAAGGGKRGVTRSMSSSGASLGAGSGLARQNSVRGFSLERTGSKRSVSQGPSPGGRGLSREPSSRRDSRSVSQDPGSRFSDDRSVGSAPARPSMGGRSVSSKPGMIRQDSLRPAGMQRSASGGRPMFERAHSSRTTIIRKEGPITKKTVNIVKTGEGSRFQYSRANRRFLPKVEYRPPKSLVFIWVIVTGELILDLITTIISFIALVNDDDCCGEPIQLGFIPLTATAPFFLLIVAEVGFLAQAVKLTMCPRPQELENKYANEPDDRWCITRWFCCCIRWNARMLFRMISWLVMLNPFFGAVVAWMLLYQSSKTECFVVLGLEGASLFLHFLAIYLEGEKQTCLSITMHLVPVLPFVVSVALILVYLQQGGVCYLVAETKFWYDGCRICDDGSPPINNFCPTNVTLWNNYTNNTTGEFVSIANRTVEWVELTDDNPLSSLFVTQGTFCDLSENGTKFCFFTYD